MAEDLGEQGFFNIHHLSGRGKETLSGLSQPGTPLWGLHQAGHHQSAAISPSSGDSPAINPKGQGGTGCPVPQERGKGALTWPRCPHP